MTESEALQQEYLASHATSAALHARGLEFFPARGATHFTRARAPFGPYMVRAEGARKWDVDGNEYVDYVMGHGALMLGHGHPAIVEAVREQALHGIHFGDNHALEIEWAELIRELVPSAERIEYFASGQEANLLAFRLARTATGRRRILRFTRHFHGWADELVAPGAPGAVNDLITVVPPGDLARVEHELAGGEFAAVMIEGGGAHLAGRIPVAPEFYRGLHEVARRHGAVFILDEVVTGFREAPGGWQAVIGIRPDLTTLGKAVGAGMPCGMLVGRADLFAPLDPAVGPERVIPRGGTWNAFPLSCAAGIAACKLYRDGAPQRRAAEAAAELRRGANAALRELGVSGRVYGRSICHIYLGPVDADADPDETTAPARDWTRLVDASRAPIYRRLDLEFLVRGVASLRGEALMFSAAHQPADVEHTVAAFRAALVAMLEDGALSPAGLVPA